jgi:hypothetical protein
VSIYAPGGWTYGPDGHGWIGFDTAHALDIWDPSERLKLCSPEMLRLIDSLILTERECGLPSSMQRRWTEEEVEREVETAARVLALRARAAFDERIRSRNGRA